MMVSTSHFFENVSENKLLNDWIKHFARNPHQLNEPHFCDAELVKLDGSDDLLAVSADTICEEISAGLYDDPYTIGWTTVMASMSDIAAAARPLGLILSVSWRSDSSVDFKDQVAAGIDDACRRLGTFLLGGDTNLSECLSFTGCALGQVKTGKFTSRFGLQPGDHMYLSYPAGLGNLAAAAKWLGPRTDAIPYRPMARLSEGRLLAEFASSCIDTSDGVFASLDQLMRLNSVGIEVENNWRNLLLPAIQIREEIPSTAYLAGYHGEYELLFSVPADRHDTFLHHAKSMAWEPVSVGRAIEENRILYADQVVDTEYFRNLFDAVSGDIHQYIPALIKACAKLG